MIILQIRLRLDEIRPTLSIKITKTSLHLQHYRELTNFTNANVNDEKKSVQSAVLVVVVTCVDFVIHVHIHSAQPNNPQYLSKGCFG